MVINMWVIAVMSFKQLYVESFVHLHCCMSDLLLDV